MSPISSEKLLPESQDWGLERDRRLGRRVGGIGKGAMPSQPRTQAIYATVYKIKFPDYPKNPMGYFCFTFRIQRVESLRSQAPSN